MVDKLLISAVRELLERHCDMLEIATRLKIRPSILMAIIETIKAGM